MLIPPAAKTNTHSPGSKFGMIRGTSATLPSLRKTPAACVHVCFSFGFPIALNARLASLNMLGLDSIHSFQPQFFPKSRSPFSPGFRGFSFERFGSLGSEWNWKVPVETTGPKTACSQKRGHRPRDFCYPYQSQGCLNPRLHGLKHHWVWDQASMGLGEAGSAGRLREGFPLRTGRAVARADRSRDAQWIPVLLVGNQLCSSFFDRLVRLVTIK